jgi:hypothetical protein
MSFFRTNVAVTLLAALALSAVHAPAATPAPIKPRLLRITEIMYNLPGPDRHGEFVELCNVSTGSVDLTGMYFQDGVGDCEFDAGPVLAPGERTIVVHEDSTGDYDGASIGARYSSTLLNGGGRIRLRDRYTNTVVSVRYDDEETRGWPKAPDGEGYSLVIIDPLGDDDDPANWRRSTYTGGSPGETDPAPAPSAVIVNEIMAYNLSTTNRGAYYPDWVELLNPYGFDVNLSGWALTDGSGAWWQFPTGVVISGTSHVMLWCDPLDDPTTNAVAGVMNTGFGLSSSRGEGVFLYNDLTNRQDAVSFGLQLADASIGRVPDGGPNWHLNAPSPGDTNQATLTASPTNLVINEWMSDPAAAYLFDWFEVYNTDSNSPVLLSGLWACTSNDADKLERPLSFIPALGFARFIRDDTNRADSTDLPLPAGGGLIALLDEGSNTFDLVVYGPQGTDLSSGRLPDGAATIRDFPASQSPGASNYLPDYAGPILSEIMADNRSAVSNAQGRSPDWIELHNPSTNTFDLSGMGLTDDTQVPGKWLFPSNSILAGDAFLRIWCDPAAPTSTTYTSMMNVGFGLSRTSDGVYLFDGVEKVNSVEYGFQVPDLSIGLTPSNGWQLLAHPTPGATNAGPTILAEPAENHVLINEWMVSPVSGPGWFEVYNSHTQLPIRLTGLYLSNNNPSREARHQVGTLCFVGPRRHVVFIADGDPTRGRDHVAFILDDNLRFSTAPLGEFQYIQPLFTGDVAVAGVGGGLLPDGNSPGWFEFRETASPGKSNYRRLNSVVINEVLSHTDDPLEDAIELHNPGPGPVNIGGWYLSQDRFDLKRFRIPDGTSLPSGGHCAFYEAQFNGGTGSLVPFQLDSALGESLYLSKAVGDALTGDMTQVAFGALLNGVSAGRWVNSRGEAHFVPLAARTFGADNPATLVEFRTGEGASNSPPRVGPIIISEIMYHPTNGGLEYVELHNAGAAEFPLYDPAHPSNTWRLAQAVGYAFETNVSIPAGGHLLVTETNAVTFTNACPVPPGVRVLGPYDGKLQNGGGALDLLQPDTPQRPTDPDPGYVPYCLVERVVYDDEAPWPAWADGHGPALERRDVRAYGNDPVNWVYYVAGGSPGATNETREYVDVDGDGMADVWERKYYTNGFDVTAVMPDLDGPDGDGIDNRREYILGFDPVAGADTDFRVRLEGHGTNLQVVFDTRAAAGPGYAGLERIYSLVRKTNALAPGGWAPVPDVNDVTGDNAPATNALPTATPHSLYRCRVRLRPAGE